MSKKHVTFVEIDLPVCSLTYGTSPCTADGESKCYNSIKTCQVRSKFAETTVTLRFAKAADYLEEAGIEAIPSIEAVQFKPGELSLGENLGIRASLDVTFFDHKHPDTGPGYDPYVKERGHDAYKTGTYWGKFRARHPFLRARAIRLIEGYVGQSLGQMTTRHFIIDSIDGPSSNGQFTVHAKDVLKLADGDRAQAPKQSKGYLVGAISASATSATLSPSGIGNKEYPASGIACIGGQEVVTFTRTGDVLTIVRGRHGTTAKAHDAQDRVQVCLQYLAQDPADILRDLFVNYAGMLSSYIPLADWQSETGSYLRRVYTALIVEPTSVNELASEVVQQAALAVWWDETTRLLRLQVLRQIDTEALQFGDDNIIQNSLTIKERPETRASQVHVYYGMHDPTGSAEGGANFRSHTEEIATQEEKDEGSAAIRTIYSRWIPAFGQSPASRLGQVILKRFKTAPRRFTFNVHPDLPVYVGGGYRVSATVLQEESGLRASIPIQVTSIGSNPGYLRIQAEELNYVEAEEEDLTNRVITIDSNVFNINLRDIHDSLYPALRTGDNVTFVVNEGVVVGSANTSQYAIDTGEWGSFIPTLDLRGRIAGAGGQGGWGRTGDNATGGTGSPGGPAFYARVPIKVKGNGAFAGGGGGGGGGGADYVGWFGPQRNGSGGGGGAGAVGGAGGGGGVSPGNPGSLLYGGDGGWADYRGGTGGGPGGPGGWSHGDFRGAPGGGGRAIDGYGNITWASWTGSIHGAVA